METWREELYHGLLANVKGRLKLNSGAGSTIGKKSVGSVGKSSGTGKGREWTKHKYVRKEGSRYIYPEDLKKRSDNKKGASENKSSVDKKNKTNASGYRSNTTRDTHQKNWDERKRANNEYVIEKTTHITKNGTPTRFSERGPDTVKLERDNYLTGKAAKEALKEIQYVVDQFRDPFIKSELMSSYSKTTPSVGGKGNLVKGTSILKYKKGKQWTDSMIIKQYSTGRIKTAKGDSVDSIERVYNEYEYTYGYLSQARMAGQNFVNSILGKKK